MTPVSPRATHSTAPNWEEGRGSGKRKEFLLRKVVDVVDMSLSDLGVWRRAENYKYYRKSTTWLEWECPFCQSVRPVDAEESRQIEWQVSVAESVMDGPLGRGLFIIRRCNKHTILTRRLSSSQLSSSNTLNHLELNPRFSYYRRVREDTTDRGQECYMYIPSVIPTVIITL